MHQEGFLGGVRKKFVGQCHSIMHEYECTIQFSSFEYETIYKFSSFLGGGGGEGEGTEAGGRGNSRAT